MAILLRLTLALVPLVAAACRPPRTTLPVDPGVTFAAHRAGDGFVVDRTRDGETGSLDRRGRLDEPGSADLILRVDAEPRAGLWVVGRTRILVRDGTSTRTPRAGEILSRWEDGAIRLTLYPRTGAPLETDVFRGQGTVGEHALSRGAEPSGTYRATVRDPAGTGVGWLRVDVGSRTLPRFYDAVLPEPVDDGLAAAAAVALDAELGWIAEHRGGGD